MEDDGLEEPVIRPNEDNSGTTNKMTVARNLAGFWLLGLCNNFGYVIMLSAAHDILADHNHNSTGNSSVDPDPHQNRSGKLIPDCNPIGTGAILLADILPALIIKLTAPWYMQAIPYNVRVALVLGLNVASFPVVAVPRLVWINLIGVVLASLASGLGEITFLSLTAHYTSNAVSTWSSGTGAAGLFGALSYAGLTALHVSPRDTILIMLVIPALMAVSYFIILVKPNLGINHQSQDMPSSSDESLNTTERNQLIVKDTPQDAVTSMTFKEKVLLVKPLLKYMIPLGLVYYAEYFINQALFELLYFPNIWLPIIQQYRWYQTIYQFGVLISRSSVNLVKIRKIWILTLLQFLVAGVFLVQIFHRFLPSIWLVFVIILFEGLLGGGAYVNTFYWISEDNKARPACREFSMGVASIADSLGIAIAGATALPVHNLICTL